MSEKIIVRVPNWIGDVVLCTPALHLLRKSLPSISITLLAKRRVTPVFEVNGDVDRIITMAEKESYSKLARRIMDNKFDTGILFPDSFSSALIFWLARIPKRVGYSTDCRSLLLTQRIKRSSDFKKEHQVIYYLQLIKRYLSQNSSQTVKSYDKTVRLMWNITGEEKRQADELLQKANISSEKKLIGINPGAAHGPAKRWLPERFAEVGNELVRKYNVEIAIFGNSDEKEIATSIVKLMKFKPLNFAGETNLRSLAALISKCTLFITNDTGPMHIASALGIPIVAIFGPTDPKRTSPWWGNHIIVQKKVRCSPCMRKKCPRKHHKCMRGVKVEDILSAIESKKFLE